MRLRRRRFLLIGAGTAVSLATAFGVLRWYRGDPKSVILAILERRVGFLQVDHASFQRFAVDYLESRKEYERELALMALFSLPYRYVTPYVVLKQGHSLRRLEANVVSRYLLSTDFFEHGADESRPVAYIEFHDPYRIACRNPFVPRPGAAVTSQAPPVTRT
ncbi:MAG: hypothetical protein ABIQ06_15330 [Caldimonas sp.]